MACYLVKMSDKKPLPASRQASVHQPDYWQADVHLPIHEEVGGRPFKILDYDCLVKIIVNRQPGESSSVNVIVSLSPEST